MALTYSQNKYTIPRGRVFFNPINTATDEYMGELYMGNCPSLGLSIETEKAEHYSSETGLREKDASVVLEVKRTGSLTCDNMSGTNVALFLSGSTGTITQAGASVTDEVIDVIPGRYYQLGLGVSTPVGARKVSAVVVTNSAGTTTYVAGTDYLLDADRGRLQILATGTIVAGEIKVDYTKAATTWEGIRSGAAGELLGALRIVSDNATGDQRDFYMPRVSLVPSGEIPVIAEGTDFAQMTFDADVLKPANGEAIYVDGMPLAT